MTTPIREMEQAYADLETRFRALGTQYNVLAEEHRQFSAALARNDGGHGVSATRDRLEWLAQEGARITHERQSLADRMSKVMSELAPTRTTLREAKRNLTYLDTAGPDNPSIVALGVRQVAQEQHRLKKLISQLEA